ncbi:MAG: hypothetical protein H0X51_07790 [Parachlamydiaceae bacterium]|nr:hypothetical protein [Parachlamydiaceae bacterium]
MGSLALLDHPWLATVATSWLSYRFAVVLMAETGKVVGLSEFRKFLKVFVMAWLCCCRDW